MDPEVVKPPSEGSGWTPEEENRIAEIIAGLDAAEVRRIMRYSSLRMEAIRRMRREQMKNASSAVARAKRIVHIASIPTTELGRDRRFGRPRKYDSNAARQRAYRARASRTLQKPSVAH